MFSHRTKLEKEVDEVKRILSLNEEALRALQTENRRTATLAIFVFVVCFAGYCLYSVYFNAY